MDPTHQRVGSAPRYSPSSQQAWLVPQQCASRTSRTARRDRRCTGRFARRADGTRLSHRHGSTDKPCKRMPLNGTQGRQRRACRSHHGPRSLACHQQARHADKHHANPAGVPGGAIRSRTSGDICGPIGSLTGEMMTPSEAMREDLSNSQTSSNQSECGIGLRWVDPNSRWHSLMTSHAETHGPPIFGTPPRRSTSV